MPAQPPRLPSSGIYTEDGYLFHHTSGRPLTKDEVERLYEHNIPYRPRSRFTPAEDEQIRKNWKRFSKKYNLDYSLAPNYAGCPGYENMFSDLNERLKFNKDTAFWPRLCRNLPHRSARQVRTRMEFLFDPAILDGHVKLPYSKCLHWTDEDTEKLLKYYKRYGCSASAMKKIGRLLKLPAHSCDNHLRSVLAHTGPVPDHYRKKLWIIVTKNTPPQGNLLFKKIVEKDIRRCRIETEQMYDHFIPWNTVAPKMVYSVDQVKDAWHSLLRSLQDYCREQKMLGVSRKEAFAIALKEVLDKVPPISCEDFSSFLHILSDATPNEALYGPFSRKLYDLDSIRSRLEEEGIVGFYASGGDEVKYLFSKTGQILRRIHVLIFTRLKMPYTLKERTQILALAYDYQHGSLLKLQSDSSEGAINSGIPLRYRFKDRAGTRHGFPMLNRGPFVEALIVYSLNTFEDWIPPTAFKKYVSTEEVIALFPERKNNTELIKQSDLDATVSFLDLDSDSEETTSESGSESSSTNCKKSVWQDLDASECPLKGINNEGNSSYDITCVAASSGCTTHPYEETPKKRFKEREAVSHNGIARARESSSRVPSKCDKLIPNDQRRSTDIKPSKIHKLSRDSSTLPHITGIDQSMGKLTRIP